MAEEIRQLKRQLTKTERKLKNMEKTLADYKKENGVIKKNIRDLKGGQSIRKRVDDNRALRLSNKEKDETNSRLEYQVWMAQSRAREALLDRMRL